MLGRTHRFPHVEQERARTMRLTLSVGVLLASLFTATSTVNAQEFGVETRKAVQYGSHDGTALIGDLYLPKGTESRPAIVAVHGGGWQFGSRDIYQYIGPYLAARGYAVFSIDYRLIRDGKTVIRQRCMTSVRQSNGCAAMAPN